MCTIFGKTIEHLNDALQWISQRAKKISKPEELSDEDDIYDIYEPHVADMLRAIDFAIAYLSSLEGNKV